AELGQPEEVPIFGGRVDPRVRSQRLAHPGLVEDALVVERAAVEIELRDLEEVAAGEAQVAACLRLAHRRVEPIGAVDSQRGEELDLCELVGRYTGRFLYHLAEHEDAPPAGAEEPAVGR